MKTLIIDNYDSFTYNLYQFIGVLGGDPKVIRNDKFILDDLRKNSFSHVVISPGPGNPTDQSYFGNCKDVILTFGKSIPILGVCLGHQGIIYAYGGKIIRAPNIRHGKTSKIKHNKKELFKDVRNPLSGMRYHSLIGEEITIPRDLEITAKSLDDGLVMAVKHKIYKTFGIQFHPESVGTDDGMIILRNFLNI